MRHAVTIAALALTVVVSGCATGAKQQEFTRTDVEAIRKGATDLSAAFNDRNVDRIVAFYADNSEFMPPNAPLLRGRGPLQSFYAGLLDKGATGLTLETDDIAGHGPLAYASGRYTVNYPNGGRDRGKYVLVLRNTSGTWRTEKMIWSSDLPVAVD